MLTAFFITNLPFSPGVYFFKDEKGNILYIGKAKNIQKRVQQYFSPGSVWKQDMLARAHKVERIETSSEQEALLLEENMIKQYQPEYNRLLKHNTQYVYIHISGDVFPVLTLTRHKKHLDQNAIYIGPKRQSRLLHMFLDYICNLYKLRTCKNTQFMKGKFCSQYDFGLCAGWCKRAFLIKKTKQDKFTEDKKNFENEKKSTKRNNFDKKDHFSSLGTIFENDQKEYQNTLFSIKHFFEGDTSFVCQDLLFRIDQAIKTQNFERAARLRDMYRAINDRTQDQHVLFDKSLTGTICVIKSIATWHVVCFLRLFDGKIVDVIRTKEWIHEMDISTLLVALKTEFGIGSDFKKREQQEEAMIFYYYVGDSDFSLEDKNKVITFTKQVIDSFLASDVVGDSACSVMNQLLHILQKRYNLTKFPYRIECVDISHLSGDYVSGGIACFITGIPYYKGYRRYRITGKICKDLFKNKKEYYKGKTAQDDYASIYEVLIRRFGLVKQNKQEKSNTNKFSNDFLPDIFVIDGGRGHLDLIRKIFLAYPNAKDILSQTCFLALGKGKARKKAHIGQDGIGEMVYYFDENFAIRQKKLVYDEADKIFIKLRDEAHRFANAYREKQASKQWKM